jgi:hypothetical protein
VLRAQGDQSLTNRNAVERRSMTTSLRGINPKQGRHEHERDGPLLGTLMKNNMSPSGGCSIEYPLGGGGKSGAGDIFDYLLGRSGGSAVPSGDLMDRLESMAGSLGREGSKTAPSRKVVLQEVAVVCSSCRPMPCSEATGIPVVMFNLSI